jgi:hypothetical protein
MRSEISEEEENFLSMLEIKSLPSRSKPVSINDYITAPNFALLSQNPHGAHQNLETAVISLSQWRLLSDSPPLTQY